MENYKNDINLLLRNLKRKKTIIELGQENPLKIHKWLKNIFYFISGVVKKIDLIKKEKRRKNFNKNFIESIKKQKNNINETAEKLYNNIDTKIFTVTYKEWKEKNPNKNILDFEKILNHSTNDELINEQYKKNVVNIPRKDFTSKSFDEPLNYQTPNFHDWSEKQN